MDAKMPHISFESMLESVDIELSGLCNADCTFCPRGKISREKTLMTPDIFEKLIRGIADIHPDGPRQIYFCGLGEPLLNKDLCRLADIVSTMLPDTLVSVVSNGSALTRELCDAILTGGIYIFSCSMQSIHREQYEASMRGARFEQVMRWMKYLAERRWETGLQVIVTYVRIDQSEEEVAEFRHFWGRLGIPVVESRLHSRGGHLDREKMVKGREVARCSLFDNRLFVAANGDVLACCQDLDGKSRIGNIGVDPLPVILERKLERIAEARLYPMCCWCNDGNAEITLSAG